MFKINFLIIRTTYVTDRDPKYFFDPNSLWLTFIHSTVDWLILSNSQLFQLFPLFMKSKSPRLPIKCSLTLSVVRLNFWSFFKMSTSGWSRIQPYERDCQMRGRCWTNLKLVSSHDFSTITEVLCKKDENNYGTELKTDRPVTSHRHSKQMTDNNHDSII